MNTETIDGVTFVDELPETERGGRGSKYEPLRAVLRAHPGRWAIFADGIEDANAANIERGKAEGGLKRKYGFQISQRKNKETGLHTIYVRYVGKKEAADG